MTFNGLCEYFGDENVILYPFKLSYMGCDGHGFADFAYMLHNENKRGFTGTSPYIKPRRLRIYPMEEIVDEMNNIDLIVLSSPRHYPVHALRFIKQLYNGIPRPVAFIDGEDGETMRDDLIEEFHPNFIFKRELTHPISDVYPLPFSSIVPSLDIYDELFKIEKTLDVFALFGNTHPIREQIIKLLLEQNLPNSYIGMDTGALPWQNDDRFKIYPLIGYESYLRKMASAKINIVLRGHGRDTVRYWEAASFETLMLIKDPGIIIPHPYEDRKHCVYFNDERDLKEKIDYYLAHDDERIAIAKSCRDHTLKYHTNRMRIEHDFLPIIRGQR
jgi:hypothetical protein